MRSLICVVTLALALAGSPAGAAATESGHSDA